MPRIARQTRELAAVVAIVRGLRTQALEVAAIRLRKLTEGGYDQETRAMARAVLAEIEGQR